MKQRPAYLQAPTQLSTRRCSESELSDFDLIGEDKDQVPSRRDSEKEQREVNLEQANEIGGLYQLDEVAGLDQVEEAESLNQANEILPERIEGAALALVQEEEATRRQRRRPNRYGDWDYSEMEEH